MDRLPIVPDPNDGYWAEVAESIIPFKIDDIEFNKVSSGNVGQWREDCLPMPDVLDITERYEVPVQQVPGYKAITQATEPVALKILHFTVTTWIKDDLERMDNLDNYVPHKVQCHLLVDSPLLMYIETKLRRVPRTGLQQFGIEWDVTLKECNDNNDA